RLDTGSGRAMECDSGIPASLETINDITDAGPPEWDREGRLSPTRRWIVIKRSWCIAGFRLDQPDERVRGEIASVVFLARRHGVSSALSIGKLDFVDTRSPTLHCRAAPPFRPTAPRGHLRASHHGMHLDVVHMTSLRAYDLAYSTKTSRKTPQTVTG